MRFEDLRFASIILIFILKSNKTFEEKFKEYDIYKIAIAILAVAKVPWRYGAEGGEEFVVGVRVEVGDERLQQRHFRSGEARGRPRAPCPRHNCVQWR